MLYILRHSFPIICKTISKWTNKVNMKNRSTLCEINLGSGRSIICRERLMLRIFSIWNEMLLQVVPICILTYVDEITYCMHKVEKKNHTIVQLYADVWAIPKHLFLIGSISFVTHFYIEFIEYIDLWCTLPMQKYCIFKDKFCMKKYIKLC